MWGGSADRGKKRDYAISIERGGRVAGFITVAVVLKSWRKGRVSV